MVQAEVPVIAQEYVMQEMQANDIYEHYKGKRYQIVGVARYSEDLSEMVVYRALYDCPGFDNNQLWVRPKAMFCENVVIDGVTMPRFKKVQK